MFSQRSRPRTSFSAWNTLCEFPIAHGTEHYLNNFSSRLAHVFVEERKNMLFAVDALTRVTSLLVYVLGQNKISFLICYSSPSNSPYSSLHSPAVPNSIFPTSIRFVAESFVRRLIYSAYLAIKETIALVSRRDNTFLTSTTGAQPVFLS